MEIPNDPFAFIPDETILEAAFWEPINYITTMCLTSKRFNNVICNNNDFWRQKFIYDFGQPTRNLNIINWKKAYQKYGETLAFGYNYFYQLGLGNNQDVYLPTQIPNINSKSIYCGYNHTAIIDLNDYVWIFGRNAGGELGLGDRIERRIPTALILSGQHIQAKTISCVSHTIIIDLNDNAWGCGKNNYGQLGLGDNQDRNIPTLLSWDQENKAKSVVCGSIHTMIIDLNNNVLGFGRGIFGQLGLGDNQDRNVPTFLSLNRQKIKARTVACGGSHTLLIKSPGSEFGDNVLLISFNEAALRLDSKDFNTFDFLPQYQTVPHKEGNLIASFYDDTGNVYLSELQYDEDANQILPPL